MLGLSIIFVVLTQAIHSLRASAIFKNGVYDMRASVRSFSTQAMYAMRASVRFFKTQTMYALRASCEVF